MTEATNNPSDPFVTVSMLDRALQRQATTIVSDITEVLKNLMGHIDERFNKVETRLDRVETSVESIRADNKVHGAHIERLESRLAAA